MKSGRRLLAAGAVCLTALGVGHVMQYGVGAGIFGAEGLSVRTAGVAALLPRLVGPADETSLPVLPAADAALPAIRVALDVPDTGLSAGLPRPEPLSAFGLPCGPAMTAEPAPNASVRVLVSAPCRPNERVEFRHAGLAFATTTSALGLIDVTIPALTRQALIEARLPDGTILTETPVVAGLHDFERVALASDGRAVLAINAFEFGARPGDGGHVRYTPGVRHSGSVARGQIVRLGDPGIAAPLQSEVYTFPVGQTLTTGAVRLHVEAEVTEATCGRAIEATAIQSMPGGPPSHVALTLDMPGCDAAGDILVLKNVLRDLRLARN